MDLHPDSSFKLIILNHNDSPRNIQKAKQTEWGFSEMMPRSNATVEAGYLRAMVIRVELSIKNIKSAKRRKLCQAVASDFLALLEQPGGTSDLTLTAGGRPFAVHRAILAARCEFFKTMFTSGFSDSTANEVPLPDADPDALAFVLRYIYGGVLDSCPRQVLKPAIELADRLLLRDVCSELEQQLVNEASSVSLVEDMLWAHSRDREALLDKLQAVYVQHMGRSPVSQEDASILASRNPQLLASLFVKLAVAKK